MQPGVLSGSEQVCMHTFRTPCKSSCPILMGVATMRGFMQQRDSHSVATFIRTAVKHVQDMARLGSGRTLHQPGWLELVSC